MSESLTACTSHRFVFFTGFRMASSGCELASTWSIFTSKETLFLLEYNYSKITATYNEKVLFFPT